MFVVALFALGGTAQAVELTNRQETNVVRASLQAGFKFAPFGSTRVTAQVGRCPVVNGRVSCPIWIRWVRKGVPGGCKVHVLVGRPGQNYGGYRWSKSSKDCRSDSEGHQDNAQTLKQSVKSLGGGVEVNRTGSRVRVVRGPHDAAG